MTQKSGTSANSDTPNDPQRDIPSGDITFEEVVEGVEEEVADLIERLPEDVGLIEYTMAEGSDPDGLERMLESLPGTTDLEQLAAALQDPVELEHLLTERDNGIRAVLKDDATGKGPPDVRGH